MYIHTGMFVISARGTPTGTWLAFLSKVRRANDGRHDWAKRPYGFVLWTKISFLVETKIVFVV